METHPLEFTDTDVEETGDATVQFGILRAVMFVSYQEDPAKSWTGVHPTK
jgi:hypothetical protein